MEITLNLFENLDYAGIGNNYDWFSLRINLKLPIEQGTIDKLKNKDSQYSEEELLSLHFLIHEYIHFLQNVTTHWGAPLLTDYALGLMKLGAANAQHNQIFQLPFDFKRAANEIGNLMDAAYQSFNNVKSRSSKLEGDIIFEPKLTYPNYSVISKAEDEFVCISNGRIRKQVGLLTVRENMAHIGANLFLGASDQEIHDINLSKKCFCSAPGLLDKQPEYWILFEYFFNSYPSLTNFGKGVYALCAEALAKLNPEKSVKRFFDWIDSNKSNLPSSDLHILVKIWAVSVDEQKCYLVSQRETLKHIQNLINLCDKHKAYNSLFESLGRIYQYLNNSVRSFAGGRELYMPDVNLADKSYWYRLLATIGSPQIQYQKRQPLIYGPTANIEWDMTILLGISKSLSLLQEKTHFVCPFLEEYKICDVAYRSESCKTQPYLVRNPNKDEGECLFCNALLLMGFKDRITV